MGALKKGFTLAEILVTLGIIGVISAVTIPQVVSQVQKQRTGAILSRAVEQINLGNQNMIQYANEEGGNNTNLRSAMFDSLDSLSTRNTRTAVGAGMILDSEVFPTTVRTYWGLKPGEVGADSVLAVTNFEGGVPRSHAGEALAANEEITYYNFDKLPAGVGILNEYVFDGARRLNERLDITVYIDTNGWGNPPNAFGRDIFVFDLRNSGKITPLEDNDENLQDGIQFTNQIVEDGFRITYF